MPAAAPQPHSKLNLFHKPMTTQQAQSLHVTLSALIARFNALPSFPQTDKQTVQSEMLQTLDPHRGFFRPYLETEFAAALNAAMAAISPYCDGSMLTAEQVARSTPVIQRLQALRDNFGESTRPIVNDAEKAVAILASYLGGQG